VPSCHVAIDFSFESRSFHTGPRYPGFIVKVSALKLAVELVAAAEEDLLPGVPRQQAKHDAAALTDHPSEGCLTISPADWTDFISRFPDGVAGFVKIDR
jgi:hypothetical protein